MGSDDRLDAAKLISPGVIMVFFWIVAVVLWQMTGTLFLLFNFLYLGTAIGVGIGLYLALPRRKKHWGRRVSQFFMGGYLLVYLGLIKRDQAEEDSPLKIILLVGGIFFFFGALF